LSARGDAWSGYSLLNSFRAVFPVPRRGIARRIGEFFVAAEI